MTAFAFLWWQSHPNSPPGPKECKHYISFDFKVVILYFQQTFIPVCTAPLWDQEVRQGFHTCGHRVLILTASVGESLPPLPPSVFVLQQTLVYDVGWYHALPLPFSGDVNGFAVFPGCENRCFCTPSLGGALPANLESAAFAAQSAFIWNC